MDVALRVLAKAQPPKPMTFWGSQGLLPSPSRPASI